MGAFSEKSKNIDCSNFWLLKVLLNQNSKLFMSVQVHDIWIRHFKDIFKHCVPCGIPHGGDGSERKEHNSDIVAQLWIHKSEFQANCGWFELFCRGWLKWTRVQWFHYVPLLGTRVRRTWCLTVLPNSPSRAWWKLYIKNCDRNCLITKFISWQFPHLSLTRAWSKEPLFVFPVRTLILFQTRRLWLGFCRLFVACRNYSSISY